MSGWLYVGLYGLCACGVALRLALVKSGGVPAIERRVRAAFTVAALTGLLLVPGQAAGATVTAPKEDYVVVFERSVRNADAATENRERALGFRSRHRYAHAFKGFAASLSRRQLDRLEADPVVDFVAADHPVAAREAVAAEEHVPAGVRRIEAATPAGIVGASSTSVAVIDTGVDLTHPDLAANVIDGKNCVDPGTSAQDDNGHGTHVAGTIAAANNGSGVVGIAAGTRVVAVKVLGADGTGSISGVICGIDWVTANASRLGIRVANMSLGGRGDPVRTCASTRDPQHLAICRSAAAGVAYVAAAGNDGEEFDSATAPDVPAAYPEVLAVTAINDTDGIPGGRGARCSRELDDRFSGFSNFASTAAAQGRTVAAPGGCVTSSRLGGGTQTQSGTSMAAPHVAGALALCVGRPGAPGPCARLPAAGAVALADELTENRNRAYGFDGDPDRPVTGRHYGYLVWGGLSALEGSYLVSELDADPQTSPDATVAEDTAEPPPTEADVEAPVVSVPSPSPDASAPVSGPAASAPVVTLTFGRLRTQPVLRSGLRVRVRASDLVRVNLRLVLPGRKAFALRMVRTSRSVTVARATGHLEAGETRVFVARFTRAAKRALAGRRATQLRLEASAITASGDRHVIPARLTLRG